MSGFKASEYWLKLHASHIETWSENSVRTKLRKIHHNVVIEDTKCNSQPKDKEVLQLHIENMLPIQWDTAVYHADSSCNLPQQPYQQQQQCCISQPGYHNSSHVHGCSPCGAVTSSLGDFAGGSQQGCGLLDWTTALFTLQLDPQPPTPFPSLITTLTFQPSTHSHTYTIHTCIMMTDSWN